MNAPEEPANEGPIELQPVVSESIPRHFTGNDRARLNEEGLLADAPIPEKPEHLCPNCDYNLTGLHSRRCPECGETFTVIEARMRAIELSDDVKRMVRWDQLSQAKTWLGIFLIVLGPWAHNVNSGSLAGMLGLQLSVKGTLLVAVMPMLFLATWAYTSHTHRTWSDAVYIAGLATGGISLLLAVL